MIIAETILLLSVSTAVAAERGTETHLPASGPVRAAQAAPAAAEDSVAIIAFSNISAIAEDDWIGMGIAETLAAELERAGDLSVVRREAVSGVLENVSSATDIARATELAAGRLVGAQWVISGAYQRVGDRIRMTARVVEVATATVVHTAIVDGTVTDLFALQDRLATDLRQRLTREGSTATPAVTARASEPAPVDAAPRATPEDADPAVERPPAAAAAPVSAAGTADPTRIINSPAPPVAPATIARDAHRRATLRAVPLTDSLEMDGVLDEDVYDTVPSFGDFIQQIPLEGEPSTERTEAWVLSLFSG